MVKTDHQDFAPKWARHFRGNWLVFDELLLVLQDPSLHPTKEKPTPLTNGPNSQWALHLFSLCVNVRIAHCSFALAAPLYTQPKEKPCQHQKQERAETFRFVFTAQLLSFMWLQTDTAIPHFWLAKLKGINK